MDAKDILGLPKSTPSHAHALSLPSEKKSRPPKESQRKPDGISREVWWYISRSLPVSTNIIFAWQSFEIHGIV